jgi:multimeric flavodoxin WrbA
MAVWDAGPARKSDRPGCVQKDDAFSVFERMMAADALIYSSPLYCWDFPAQMKALIDRHFCLVTGYGTSQPPVTDRR